MDIFVSHPSFLIPHPGSLSILCICHTHTASHLLMPHSTSVWYMRPFQDQAPLPSLHCCRWQRPSNCGYFPHFSPDVVDISSRNLSLNMTVHSTVWWTLSHSIIISYRITIDRKDHEWELKMQRKSAPFVKIKIHACFRRWQNNYLFYARPKCGYILLPILSRRHQ